MTRTKVGVVGVGRMGNLHLRKFSSLPGVEVAGIYEPNSAHAEAIAGQYGVRAFGDLQDLLFDSDAICIASPTHTHFSIARLALEAGVHCLVEKPIAVSVEEGEALIMLADARGLVLQVGLLERHRFRELTRGHPVAAPRYMECRRMTLAPGREADIDVISDLMIHDLDLTLSLMGEEPSSVSAIGAAVVSPLYDLANVRLEFPSGAVANLSASRISPEPLRKVHVFSGDAYTAVDLHANVVEISRCSSDRRIERRREELPQLDALAAQSEDFIAAICGRREPLVSGRDGVRALRCAERVRESIARRARPLRVGDARGYEASL